MYNIETYTGCLHTEKDISLLIELCLNNILPTVRRRLNEFERRRIKNGSIFVYEESESNIKRWTDGKIWSPSRCSGLFLVYVEHATKFNHKLLMKKTLTAKLKNSVYHIIAYVNMDEELNGICCLKYGNRLAIIHTHCNNKKNMQEKKDVQKEEDISLKKVRVDENADQNVNVQDKIMTGDPKQIENKSILFKKSQEDPKTPNFYVYATNTSHDELVDENDNFEHKKIEKKGKKKSLILDMNSNGIYNADEYFYLENPLYKKMNHFQSIDSSEQD